MRFPTDAAIAQVCLWHQADYFRAAHSVSNPGVKRKSREHASVFDQASRRVVHYGYEPTSERYAMLCTVHKFHSGTDRDTQTMTNKDKIASRGRGQLFKTGQYLRLQPYAGRRPREYLTAKEVERLIAGAKKVGRRYGLRDITEP